MINCGSLTKLLLYYAIFRGFKAKQVFLFYGSEVKFAKNARQAATKARRQQQQQDQSQPHDAKNEAGAGLARRSLCAAAGGRERQQRVASVA